MCATFTTVRLQYRTYIVDLLYSLVAFLTTIGNHFYKYVSNIFIVKSNYNVKHEKSLIISKCAYLCNMVCLIL